MDPAEELITRHGLRRGDCSKRVADLHGTKPRATKRRRQKSHSMNEPPLPPELGLAAQNNQYAGPVFWPDVLKNLRKAYLVKHVGIPLSTLGLPTTCCSICDKVLIISGLQPPTNNSADDKEPGVLLACGHVMGLHCIESWKQSCAAAGQQFSCPLCRFNLAPIRCKNHRFEPFIYLGEESQEFGLLDDNVQPSARCHVQEDQGCRDCAQERLNPPRARLDSLTMVEIGAIAIPQQLDVKDV